VATQMGWVWSLPEGSTVVIAPKFLPCANSTVAGCSSGPSLLVAAMPSAPPHVGSWVEAIAPRP
jgi:hypothetical protein